MAGPSYCEKCGEWPASQTQHGLRCHLCECRDIAEDHPVPLPKNKETLKTLAEFGYQPAIEEIEKNEKNK
jgi:hypothetical protein